jgi:hypothetical protein
MLNPTDDRRNLYSAVRSAELFLAKLYGFELDLKCEDFITKIDENLGPHGRVLVSQQPASSGQEYQSNTELQLGIEFGAELVQNLWKKDNSHVSQSLSISSMAIVIEEVSHFHLLTHAAFTQNPVSLLELEILGEIDRFVSLLYWNSWNNIFPLSKSWTNISQLCEELFGGIRFQKQTDPIYFQAETSAFKHLKSAFECIWDHSNLDVSFVPIKTINYLRNLRCQFLGCQAELLPLSA